MALGRSMSSIWSEESKQGPLEELQRVEGRLPQAQTPLLPSQLALSPPWPTQ